MKFHVSMGLKDYLINGLYSLFTTKFVVFLIIFSLLLQAITLLPTHTPLWAIIPLALISTTQLFIFIIVILVISWTIAYKRHPENFHDVLYDIQPNNLTITSSGIESKIAWSAVKKVKIAIGSVFFYYKNGRKTTIPVSSIPKHMYPKVQTLLQKKHLL